MSVTATGLVVQTWGDITRGDSVKVLGVRGDFTFYSARLDGGGNVMWVTVFGGSWQHKKFRHFKPGLVSRKKGK